jgi:hypothetical protein
MISTRSGSHTCNAEPVEQQAHESRCSDLSLNPDPSPIFTCQGRTYLCKRLDLGERLAVVRPADLKYYTKTRDFCDVHVIGGRALLPHNVRAHFIWCSVVQGGILQPDRRGAPYR